MKSKAAALGLFVCGASCPTHGRHLPPVTPVLPGQDHRHENHAGSDFQETI
jgi:hypothetical protein